MRPIRNNRCGYFLFFMSIEYLRINSRDKEPIYRQIITGIYKAIEEGHLKKGDLLPSVNKIASEFKLARGSVFKAYNEMKAAGIIDAWPGKGYYVVSTAIKRKQNIMFLLDGFAPYKQIIYNSFITNIRNHAKVDIYFHHFNINILEALIKENLLYYNYFVIVPPPNQQAIRILKVIPQKQLYILDLGYKELGKKYPSVCQNFEKDIYQTLYKQQQILNKYKKLILVMETKHVAQGIRSGFIKFCKKYKYNCETIPRITANKVTKGSAFIVTHDNDLVKLIHLIKERGLKLKENAGIISYNETPLKSVIADGITTISTDFALMGKTMAEMILEHKNAHIENPCTFTLRKSL